MADIFEWKQKGSVLPAAGWSFVTGNFTGNAIADVAAYHPSDGSLWVGSTTGGDFLFTQWATVDPKTGWTILSGNFVGDAYDDLVAYHPSDGSIWVGTNMGSSFVFSQWATVIPASGWSFQAGDFTGDGRTDLMAYHPSDGSVWVGVNTGSSFVFIQWATVDSASGWTFQVGDFTRNGRVDIVAHYARDGSVWVGRNTGSSFAFGAAAYTTPPAEGWTLIAGNFSEDGATDLGAYLGDTGSPDTSGTFRVGRSTLAGDFFFASEAWAKVSPPSGWTLVPGNFTADNRNDLFAYHPSDGSIWIGENRGTPAEGYAWPLSAAPGEVIQFYVSGPLVPVADIVEHTVSGDSVIGDPKTSVPFTPTVQPLATSTPWRDGVGWQPSFSLTIPASWRSGVYSARLRSVITSEEAYVTFVVKPKTLSPSGVAVLANVNTWLAYNSWGGKSKYDGAALNSFLRPILMRPAYPEGHPSPVGLWDPFDHLARAEIFLLSWLQKEGYQPDVYTDIDFHNHGVPAGYHKLIVGTHPEYWTYRMRDQLDAFLGRGGSLLYLGGNGLFETAAYIPGQTGMTFLEGVEDSGGYRAYATFRVKGRHERQVLGVATTRCLAYDDNLGRGFRVKAPDHAVFLGLGVVLNQTFAKAGGGASGHEVDTMRSKYAKSLPCQLWQPNSPSEPPPEIPSSGLPQGIVLLARAYNPPGYEHNVFAETVGADMTFYRHPRGGFVFSTGSIPFGHSLSQDAPDAVLPRLMRNVLNMN